MKIPAPAMSLIARGLPMGLRSAGKQRLSILIYHRVLPRHDYLRPAEPDTDQFAWQMEILSRYCTPLSLTEATRRMAEGSLPERAVCVTFDDGYADNYELALPILQRWRVPATVFVATGFLNGGMMWNDVIIESVRSTEEQQLDCSELGLGLLDLRGEAARRAAVQAILPAIKHLHPERRAQLTAAVAGSAGPLPDTLMMTDDQLRAMHDAGIQIGAHTRTHPILASVEDGVARAEIERGKGELEALIDHPVEVFAYPNGRFMEDFLPAHRDMLAGLGFRAAVTTEPFVATPGSDTYMLPRFTPWDRTPARFLARLMMSRSQLQQPAVGI